MSIPTKLEQALNYKWHPGNVDILHRLLIEEVQELRRRLDAKEEAKSKAAASYAEAFNKGKFSAPEIRAMESGVSLYDSDPDGLEA